MISIILPNRNEERVHEVIAEIEKILPGSQVVIAVDRDSRGKGWAVRKALEYASGDVIAFLDADMDIEPRMLLRLLPFLDDYDIVVGTKGLTGMLSRKCITWLSRLYIRVMFGLPVDTQTGIKIFRQPALQTWDTDGYCFDVEILARAKKAGARMIEVPIQANIVRHMAAKSVFKTLKESIKIWLALKSR